MSACPDNRIPEAAAASGGLCAGLLYCCAQARALFSLRERMCSRLLNILHFLVSNVALYISASL